MNESHINNALELMNEIHGITTRTVSPEVDVDPRPALATYFAALQTETGELLNELPWKPWKEYPPIDDEKLARIMDEYADVLAFVGVITFLLGRVDDRMTPEALARAYHRKVGVIFDRLNGEVAEYKKLTDETR